MNSKSLVSLTIRSPSQTSACVFNMEAHNGAITEILITQGYLLSSSVDNKINIWDKTTGNLVNTIDHVSGYWRFSNGLTDHLTDS